MEIKEAQENIFEFAKKRAAAKGFDLTSELSYIHLTEELGEVARQLSNKKMRPEKYDEANLREEIVDVILEALILAKTCDVDVGKEITLKREALKKRFGF
jgi:NTP pyrophosphatase (non-canonical NTP hydrolase)